MPEYFRGREKLEPDSSLPCERVSDWEWCECETHRKAAVTVHGFVATGADEGVASFRFPILGIAAQPAFAAPRAGRLKANSRDTNSG